MTRSARLGSAALLFALGAVPDADAAARVFVSVNGNDLNTCSNIATPCRTLDAGVTQVDAAGEVIVLTTGSYAGATIGKSVRVNVPTGVVAFSASTITVNPGAGNVVVLRGLTIKALTPGTGTGIDHQSGILFVENTVVDGWADGLSSGSAERLFVKGSVFRNNAGVGLWVKTGSTASVAIDQSFFENNFAGIHFEGGTGRVSNTAMTGNTHGAAVRNAGTEATFQRCEVSGNNQGGLEAYSSAVLRVSESTLTRNAIAGLYNETATLESFGNNVIRGNAMDTSGIITPVSLQ